MPITPKEVPVSAGPATSLDSTLEKKKKSILAGVHPVDEFVIGNRVYNISEFKKRHPGGGVINFMAGTDATQSFNIFHDRSPKAQKMLKLLPSRPYEGENAQEPSELIKDFAKLRQEFIDEGLFEPSYIHIAYRITEVFAFFFTGMYLVLNGWYWTGVFLMGMAQGRCGWLQHEAGHYSLTGNIKYDRMIQYLFMCIGAGLSAKYWRNMHNRHHATPQKHKHDVDLQTLPLIAFHKIIAKEGNPDILKYQALTFLPGTFLTSFFWTLRNHPLYVIRTNSLSELPGMLLNHAIRLYVGKDMTWTWMFITYFLILLIQSVYLFGNFALNHTHKPVLPADEHVDWIRGTALHTCNVSPTMWCNWWMGYLNWQIEHHLFPSMPQFRNQVAAPRVKALFEKHGLYYDSRSYPEAVKATFFNLHTVGNTIEKKTQ